MLVEVTHLALPHAAVALLHHLGVGHQAVKGYQHTLGTDHVGQQHLQRGDDAANGIVGLDVAVQKAVEVDAQAVDVQGRARHTDLLDVLVGLEQ